MSNGSPRRFRRTASAGITAALLISLAAGGLSNGSARAADPSASYTALGYTWKPVRIGGGGNMSGIDAADDGTLIARTDVHGAYVLDPGATEWRQLLTTASVPWFWQLPKLGKGAAGVAIAPNNSARMYVMWAGHVLASSDRGRTFNQTSFAPTNWDANGGFGKGFGDRIAVDPINPDHVIAGAPNIPLRRSTDGGVSWLDTTVPAGASYLAESEINSPGITGVLFDRTGGVSGGKTNVAYAASWGNGIYRTADGGATWSSIGGPSAVHHATIDAAGTYYVSSGTLDGPFSVWSYNTTNGWRDITPPGWNPFRLASVENPFIAANPLTSGTVVLGYAQQMFRTDDSGTTWRAMTWSDGPGDVKWADNPASVMNPYLVTADLIFDRTASGRMWMSTGSGVQTATLAPNSDTVVWNERTRGIENMVATDVVSTLGSTPIFSVFDFGQFGGSANLDNYSLIKGPVPFFSGTTSMDASPFTAGFAVSATTDYVDGRGYPNSASYTTNGGKSWTKFPTMPKGANTAEQFGYGAIAVSSASNIVWAPGRYFTTGTEDFQPYVTKDLGKTWKPVVLPGVTSYPEDSIGGFMFGRNYQMVAADQVRAGVFYLYMVGKGVFRSVDGGTTWAQRTRGYMGLGPPDSGGSLQAMPGREGNLFWSDGTGGGHDWQGPQQYAGYPFMRSTDGGAVWTPVRGVSGVMAYGFGAAAPSSAFATIYIVGRVNNVYGIYRSTDNAATWTKIADFPYTVDWVTSISGDKNAYGTVYVGFAGSSFVYGKPA